MRIELRCPACSCRFVAPAQASEEEIRERMFNDGPWYSLGDGNTFEDMIFATLMERGAITCPECGDAVSVSEESLGQLVMEMLAGF
jgi:DNA-directed RNA polymerase subunit RPC12/RpoP